MPSKMARPGRKSPESDPRVKLALARLMLEEADAKARELPVWAPHPGNQPQMDASRSDAAVVGYGGAAGGGKTDLLIGLAATQHQKSIIFRREYPQLKDIIRRAKDMTEGKRVGFNGQDGMLTLPQGRTIEFGAMKDADDWEKYKGRPHDLKAYDEATEFLELQVRKSSAWLRTTTEGQRTRIVLTFNPPTNIQGMWVIRYFAPWLDPCHPDPAKPGEIRWFATVDGREDTECDCGDSFYHNNELIEPVSRTFFPARLADNPHLMATNYGQTLNALPEPLRSQLLYGSFEASMSPDPWQVVPTAWVEAAFARWRALGGVPGDRPLTCMGVDVAHGGKDKTVIAKRFREFVANLLRFPGKATPDGRAAAALVKAEHADEAYINVDSIGYGAATYERLKDGPPEGFGLPACAINFACASNHTDKSKKYGMVNLRAEAYWRLREELDPDNGAVLALPPDSELKNELCEGRYEITPRGIKIEPKEDIIERLGHSPDAADAVALTTLPNGQPHAVTVDGPRPAIAPMPDTTPRRMPQGIPGASGGAW